MGWPLNKIKLVLNYLGHNPRSGLKIKIMKTYTDKEVRVLLRKQIRKVANSFMMMPSDESDTLKIYKRILNCGLVKITSEKTGEV